MKLPNLKGRGALVAAAVTILAGAGALSLATARQIDPGMKPAYLKAFPDFAPGLTPQMPGDVDIALKTELEKAQQFAKVQREFDLYSWQMFLALNWPTNGTGQPADKITDTSFGAPHWTLWHSSSDIFQTDGATPAACEVQTAARAQAVLKKALTKPVSKGLKAFSAANIAADPRGTRYLGVLSAVGEINAATPLSEIGQAFTGPMIDQNGEFVFYEILMDPNEVNYVCQNGLYNINGQVAFSQAGKTVNMPFGTPDKDWSGSFEIKLAWKIMTPGKDIRDRFYTMPAVVMDEDANGNPVERKVVVGLVGMHIGHKSKTSPQWIWSTFEHVDNLDVDPIAHPGVNPSFNDPNCEICTVNQLPQQVNGVYPRVPTQASRTIPIPADKQALNAQAQAVLRKAGSVWQYYQLIDTQWPTSPSTKPTPWNGGLGLSVENKPGGMPTPVMLTNITMETYFQAGNQQACNAQENVPNDANCVSPPSAQASAAPPIWTSPLNNSTQPDVGLPGINTTIFATESCMGCHSSAGIYTSYDPKNPNAAGQSGQLTGDFSWLFSQKAAWNTSAGTTAKPKKKS